MSLEKLINNGLQCAGYHHAKRTIAIGSEILAESDL